MKSAEELLRLFERAWERRRQQAATLDMFRLFDGAADGEARLFADVIGSFLLIHILDEGDAAHKLQLAAAECAAAIAKLISVESVFARVHHKDPKRSGVNEAVLLFGPGLSEVVVKEHGLSFIARPKANVNAGIFLDTRDLRALLKISCRELKVLNTFCFTGSLGIAAYAGGAREVVQVDSSKAILNWARENFELNKSSGKGKMRFISEDCLTFMQREARRIKDGSDPYDVVIIDPPSFGKAGNKVFSLRRDLPKLLDAACNVGAQRFSLSVTCNTRSLAEDELASECEAAVRRCGFRVVKRTRLHAPPEDFLAQAQDSIAARGQWLQLEQV